MRVLPRHPAAMVAAVGLACVVWYSSALDRRERISERQLDAPVTFVNVPVDMVITSDVPRTLTLRVRGSLSRLRSLDPAQTGVVLDLRGAGEGALESVVEARNVAVPAGVQVLAVTPSQVPLRLERMVRRWLPIKPKVVGEPAPAYEVATVTCDPPSALLSGPRLQLDALKGVSTDPLTVEGAEGNVTAVVAVRSPLPLARIVEPLSVRATAMLLPTRGDTRGGRRR